ncbi:MAG TPA: glycosyltransferase, partial [Candidatus Dormibacteraeota bacterium]|nr:glycosyltransferase [Candidatus Dormibacteraeota bacterium]
AFTDSDCIPDPQWLVSLLAAFEDPKVGVVQGRTIGTETRIPLFEHHVESLALDGRYATANAAFRRSAVAGMKFNPACWYWEDIDLAWRVLDQGWQPAYVQEAVVRHRIIPLPALAWILWPRHSAVLPAICRAHPGFRRHLFARVWVSPMNLWFEVGVIGVLLAPWRWVSLVLTLPYAFSFARHRGVAGRFPPAKIAAYVARDLVGLISLLGASLRRRALVL